MKILGIETSCDETAAAVVEDGHILLGNSVASSIDLHAAFGGVVPEIAARSHIELILPVITGALEAAEAKWDDIDAIAVTVGPGLSGSLLVGVLTASTIAIVKDKPLYPINHVEAHVYANFITRSAIPGYILPNSPPQFPLLALIVSGGHTQLVMFSKHFNYRVLGQTTDDAAGEAFDKVAKILGLSYPGGPSISNAAKYGNPAAVALPKASLTSPYNFSFSGLKTAVLRASQQMAGKDFRLPSSYLPALLSESQKNDIAASFQKTAIETLVEALAGAFKEFRPKSVVIAGGVAANRALRDMVAQKLGDTVRYTDPALCTDNGAMIAALAGFKMVHGQKPTNPYNIDINPSLQM